MNEKFLPIGTVCMLKGGEKRIMITGFCTVSDTDKKMYDYSGCVYPEGVLSSKSMFLFNHNQIDKIYYMGYVDEEEKKFKATLNTIVKKIESGEISIEDFI